MYMSFTGNATATEQEATAKAGPRRPPSPRTLGASRRPSGRPSSGTVPQEAAVFVRDQPDLKHRGKNKNTCTVRKTVRNSHQILDTALFYVFS